MLDPRVLTRVALLGALGTGVLVGALHLDPAGASATGPGSASAPASPAFSPVAATRGSRLGRTGADDAQAGLLRSVTRPLRAADAVASPAPAGSATPRRQVVDPATGGRISLSGAVGVLPDAADLGPMHEDPMPVGASISAPTDTASLLERAGVVESARADATPLAQGATAPVGTPGVSALSAHVVPSCSGTGSDGHRVQPMYVHESGTPDRYAQVLPVLRNEVASVDDVFAVSAQQTGGQRRVRWVHDASCLPVVKDVTVPSGALGSDFYGTVNALKALGYQDPARKYLVFADANQFCGIGSVYDDPRLTGNANDGSYPSYARVDANCWSTSTSVAAHELTHNLGGVLGTAPHATKHGHCWDDSDLMCYDDGSGIAMKQVCASAQEQLLDCNHDDYFSTDPPAGSFLAKNWNTASSSFLDSVLLPAAPDVTVTPSTIAATTGRSVSLTATSSKPVTWAWSTSTDAAGCTLSPVATGRISLSCPSTVTGSLVVTATATRTDVAAASTGHGSATVTMTRAAAPTAVASAPAAMAAGSSVAVGVTATGGSPLTYAWSAPGCSFAAPALAATTLTCPADTPTGDLVVSALVTQSDGQSVRASTTVHVSGGTATPPPTAAPVATSWTPPTYAGSSMTSRLRTAGGAALAGRTVDLQAQWFGTGTWVTLRQLSTDATGRAAAGLAYGRAGSFRFVSRTDASFLASSSSAVLVKVRTVSTAGRPSRHRVTGSLRTSTGQGVTGTTLVLQRRTVGSARWVRSALVRTDARGQVSRTVRPRRPTAYRWVFAGGSQLLPTSSRTVTVR